MITISAVGVADAIRAYFVVPQAGSGPGIVLRHTAFGLDRYIRDMAELYAGEGYASGS